MTIQEVAEELHKDFKCYVGVCTKSTFFQYIRRIKLGKMKLPTIEAFYRKFGYEGSFNEWNKPNIKP